MTSVPDIFAQIGTVAKVAQILGVQHSTASEMKRRGSIPVRYWPALVDGCKGEGITGIDFDLLVRVHADAPQSEQPA